MKNLPSQFSIHVENEKQSREAQEKLFGLGYQWGSCGKNYFNHGIDYLDVNAFNDNLITCCSYAYCSICFSFEKFIEIAEQGSKGDSSPLKIFCIPDKTEAALICKWVEERGMDSFSESRYADCFMLGSDAYQTFDRIGSKEGAESNGYKLVSVFEFIYALGQIPVPQKPVEIEVLPWKVVIKGDKFDIGCQKDKDISLLKKAIKYLESSEEGIGEWLGYSVKFARHGFRVNGKLILWETWDKFIEEANKVIEK